jgi:serine/threonine-protein kinase
MEEPRAGDLVTSKLRLVRPLGAGGMGSVWLADHLALHTQVVVKFIAASLQTNKDAIARFEREAAAASQVKSPHVVQILDHGISDSRVPFIVMELLEGRDLAAHLEEFGRASVEDASEIVAQLCRALTRAHERGIVHRDIKPHNIFLCDAGGGELFVKLLDFGIAKGATVEKLDESTKTGTMVGSPYYMSPEQLVGAKDIDFHTDLWSTAVVAFEAMTGTKPFEGETIGALALRIHTEAPPIASSRSDTINAATDAWFERAFQRKPNDRFASAREMADALVVAVTGDSTRTSMTSSGSGVAPIRSSMTLAKTVGADGSAPLDANAQSIAGVSTASVPKPRNTPRIAIGVGVAVAATLVGFFAVSRAMHDDRPATAASIVIAASAAPSSSPPPLQASTLPLVTSDPPVAPSVKISAPLPSLTPTIAKSARPQPSARPTATVNEDDIK